MILNWQPNIVKILYLVWLTLASTLVTQTSCYTLQIVHFDNMSTSASSGTTTAATSTTTTAATSYSSTISTTSSTTVPSLIPIHTLPPVPTWPALPLTSPAPISAVTIKIPPFWPTDPEVWFAQVEAQFATKGITVQKTKFDHVVASLSPEYAREVRDLILKPPTTDPYDELKNQLVKRTTASESRRLQQLFNKEELGDRTPSQLLRHMKQLLGDKSTTADHTFLRELFLQRLPQGVRMVLAATTKESDDLETVAALADKVGEVATPTVSAVETPTLSSEVEQLRQEISSLKTLVQSHQRPRPRSKSRQRTYAYKTSPPPPNPSDTSSCPTLCWYHSRFGKKAAKCIQPCNWDSGNAPAGR